MAKTATNGRPASPFPERYQIRHDADQLAAWKAAAATCGLSLQDWIRAALGAEARKATHVPMIKREGRRG